MGQPEPGNAAVPAGETGNGAADGEDHRGRGKGHGQRRAPEGPVQAAHLRAAKRAGRPVRRLRVGSVHRGRGKRVSALRRGQPDQPGGCEAENSRAGAFGEPAPGRGTAVAGPVRQADGGVRRHRQRHGAGVGRRARLEGAGAAVRGTGRCRPNHRQPPGGAVPPAGQRGRGQLDGGRHRGGGHGVRRGKRRGREPADPQRGQHGRRAKPPGRLGQPERGQRR